MYFGKQVINGFLLSILGDAFKKEGESLNTVYSRHEFFLLF